MINKHIPLQKLFQHKAWNIVQFGFTNSQAITMPVDSFA